MKKYLMMLTACTLLACGGNGNSEQQTEQPSEAADTPKGEQVGEVPEGLDGAQLIAGSDCLACHKVDQQLVGPSYHAVAEKYEDSEANIALLASKIIQGGSGNWGTVPMTPHPQISVDEAEAMAKYILSLK